MIKFLVTLISLIALISLIVNFGFIKKIRDNNRVIEVVDGDTFQLQSKERVRLLGVDAPELERCGGPEARKRLSELILNKIVELKEPVKENFGRTMALVYLDKVLINKIMMEEGWGKPDYKKNSQRNILSSAYAEAQKQRLGLWSFCINPKSNCLIKGNIDTATYDKFYHLQYCRHYDQIVLNTAYGDSWFCSEQEAAKAGFIKSKSCDQ